MYIYIHESEHVYECIYAWMYLSLSVCVCIRVRERVCLYEDVSYMYTRICVRMYVCTKQVA